MQKVTVKDLFLFKLQTAVLKQNATKTKKMLLKLPLKLPLNFK